MWDCAPLRVLRILNILKKKSVCHILRLLSASALWVSAADDGSAGPGGGSGSGSGGRRKTCFYSFDFAKPVHMYWPTQTPFRSNFDANIHEHVHVALFSIGSSIS